MGCTRTSHLLHSPPFPFNRFPFPPLLSPQMLPPSFPFLSFPLLPFPFPPLPLSFPFTLVSPPLYILAMGLRWTTASMVPWGSEVGK